VKIGFKFQSLGKISNISAADPTVLLGQFQRWGWVTVSNVSSLYFCNYTFTVTSRPKCRICQ